MQTGDTSDCASHDGESRSEHPVVPRWDERRRTIFFGGSLVKHFRQPAPMQELILSAFEEERWPCRIDDPLPPRPRMGEEAAKARLRSAVENLNRAQHGPICIYFFLDGTGQGVLWRMKSE